MDTTMLLSQIWGPVILAIGLGIFVSRLHYTNVYRNLANETLAVLTFGIVTTILGVIQVQIHTAWGNLPQVIVSLLGWALLIKGLMFIIAPRFVEKTAERVANSKMIPVIGGLTIVVGAYLSWLGYFVV